MRALATRLAHWPPCEKGSLDAAVSVADVITRQTQGSQETPAAKGARAPLRVRGFLVPGPAGCTEMACVLEGDPHAEVCCNGCSGTWTLSSTADGESAGLSLRSHGGGAGLGFSVMDCARKDLARGCRGVELLVEGIVVLEPDPVARRAGETDRVEYTAVCVVQNPMASKVQPLRGQVPFDRELGVRMVD